MPEYAAPPGIFIGIDPATDSTPGAISYGVMIGGVIHIQHITVGAEENTLTDVSLSIQEHYPEHWATICPCKGDEWCLLLLETGYPYCIRCHEHHRHPETCPGVTEDGDEAPYPEFDDA